MSAIAGRVLILPKGDYDASLTYEFLDLVNHKSSSWLAKKASTGIEPSDANSEFWQKFGSSVTPDGVTIVIDENGVISAVGGTAEKVTYENESVADVTNVKEALDGIFNGTQPVGDSAKLGGKDASEYATDEEIKNNSIWNDLTEGFDLNNALGKYRTPSGAVIKTLVNLPSAWTSGELSVDWIPFDSTNVYGMQILTYKSGSNLSIYHRAKNSSTWGNWQQYLHTGNKPTGTYTGNGSSTERVIETGGIGHFAVVWANGTNNDAITLLTTRGGYVKKGNTINGLSRELGRFQAGSIYMNTTDLALNQSGVTYQYEVH